MQMHHILTWITGTQQQRAKHKKPAARFIDWAIDPYTEQHMTTE